MTLQEFIAFCVATDAKMLRTDACEEIYNTYSDDDSLREAIYAEAERLGVVLQECNEPMRASLEAIGKHYHCEILANW